MTEYLKRLVETAEESIRAAAVQADRDPTRPRYHFRAPAQWMDDPNGIIFHDGAYHMMYSLNPHSAAHRAGMVYKTAVRVWDPNSEDWTGGITVWGHARSTDLLHWEHLPIALYPSIEKGEHFIWFGCTVINDEGAPMAIYTAVGPELRPEDTAQQWAALGSPDLVEWRPLPSNPLLSYTANGADDIGEWRDPFVFKEEGRTFMILGGRLRSASGGCPVVALYEATTPGLTQWVYRGIIYRDERSQIPSLECPNLVKLGNLWVLLFSPHGEVEYRTGELDLQNYAFRVIGAGVVDHSRNFYATNVLFDATRRALMWGAIVGFHGTQNWNGCLSLPREITLTREGRLRQSPARELRALRQQAHKLAVPVAANAVVKVGEFSDCDALEIVARFAKRKGRFGLRIRSKGSELNVIAAENSISVGDLTFNVEPAAHLQLHVFVDRTVAEIFVNDASAATLVIPLMNGDVETELVGLDGEVEMVEIEAWRLDAEGLFRFHDDAARETSN